jgi:hypothetical protein
MRHIFEVVLEHERLRAARALTFVLIARFALMPYCEDDDMLVRNEIQSDVSAFAKFDQQFAALGYRIHLPPSLGSCPSDASPRATASGSFRRIRAICAQEMAQAYEIADSRAGEPYAPLWHRGGSSSSFLPQDSSHRATSVPSAKRPVS